MRGKMPTPELCKSDIARWEAQAASAHVASGRNFDRAYLYLSTSKSDIARRKEMHQVAEKYYTGGIAGVHEVDGVRGADPTQTCSLEYGKYLASQHLINRTGDCAVNKQMQGYYCTDSQGMTTSWNDPPSRMHHWGCGHSHLIAWLSARGRSADALLTQESDGHIGSDEDWGARMWPVPGEFDDVIEAIVNQAPEGWHLVHLDLPLMQGVSAEARDADEKVRVRNKVTESFQWARGREYHLYKWVGGGYAGTGHVLFSKRFLEELPSIIDEDGYDMVDAWLGRICGHGPAVKKSLECYSLIPRDLAGK